MVPVGFIEDLATGVGVAFSHGRAADGLAQPMTMNLKLANVDTAAIRDYVRRNTCDFHIAHRRSRRHRSVRAQPRRDDRATAVRADFPVSARPCGGLGCPSATFSPWGRPAGQFHPGHAHIPFSVRGDAQSDVEIQNTFNATSYPPLIDELEKSLIRSTLSLRRNRGEQRAFAPVSAGNAKPNKPATPASANGNASYSAPRKPKPSRKRLSPTIAAAQAGPPAAPKPISTAVSHFGKIARATSFPTTESSYGFQPEPIFDNVHLSGGDIFHGSLQFCSASVRSEHLRMNSPDCFGRGFKGTPTTQTVSTISPYNRTYTFMVGTTWHETGNVSTHMTVRSYA